MKNRIQTTFVDRKSDREINGSLRRRLDHGSHGRLRRIHTDVQQGTAVLWGFVKSEKDRDLAVEIADSCPRVDTIIDRLQLEPADEQLMATGRLAF